MNLRRFRRGVTLTELMIATSVFSIVSFLGVVGLKSMNNFFRQKVSIESERDAQLVLYQIARDVRNSQSISQINQLTGSPVFATTPPVAVVPANEHRLVLKSFDYSGTHDIRVKSDLFSAANEITITYEYKNTEGGYLERSHQLGGVTSTKKLLKGSLKFDTEAVPTPIFVPSNQISNSPYTSVQVSFKIQPDLNKKSPVKTFQATVALRN